MGERCLGEERADRNSAFPPPSFPPSLPPDLLRTSRRVAVSSGESPELCNVFMRAFSLSFSFFLL